VKKASRLEIGSYEHVVELFLTHRAEIRHPEPRLAISTGLMMVVSTIYELIVLPYDTKPWKGLLPRDDQALKRELVRSFLSYLGVEQKHS
jgi:hypothetical protein